MNPTGIDYLTVYDTHPIELIPIVAAAGAETLSIPAVPIELGDGRFFSILHDAQLQRDIKSCLADHGVRIGQADLVLYPGDDPDLYIRGFAALAGLGVDMVNCVSFDTVRRSIDACGKMAEAAADHGITLLLEACPVLTVGTLEHALSIIQQLGCSNVRLMIDTMHVSRSGEAERIAALDPSLIGYVQVADAPLAMPPSMEAYMEEAMYERMIPGEGELPLLSILRHIPDGVIVSPEVPQRSALQAGRSKIECAKRALEATRRLLEQAQPARLKQDES